MGLTFKLFDVWRVLLATSHQ